MTSVVDSSAILAWLRNEPGADVVHPLLPAAVVCAANWSETYQKLMQHGADAHRVLTRLSALGVRVEHLTETDAVIAASLWSSTRTAGLSLGDRCCLALASRLGLAAVTADTTWTGLDLDVTVQVIR